MFISRQASGWLCMETIFNFSRNKHDIIKTENKMTEWYDIKLRGIMGSDHDDIKTIEVWPDY